MGTKGDSGGKGGGSSGGGGGISAVLVVGGGGGSSICKEGVIAFAPPSPRSLLTTLSSISLEDTALPLPLASDDLLAGLPLIEVFSLTFSVTLPPSASALGSIKAALLALSASSLELPLYVEEAVGIDVGILVLVTGTGGWLSLPREAVDDEFCKYKQAISVLHCCFSHSYNPHDLPSVLWSPPPLALLVFS